MNKIRKISKEKLRRKKVICNKRSFILFTIICIGIGFAYLSSNLMITGRTSVSRNSWNIYFTNVQVTDGSVGATVIPTTTGTNTTSINYSVILDKPGDFYEFRVDVVNDGTIDAMIQNINMTSLDADVAKYLTYTATYLDGTELAINDVLEADDSTTYKVRVEFNQNILATDLDENGINLTLIFGVDYVQSTMPPKPVESQFAKLVSDEALNDSSINFGAISSDSNGQGLYVMNNTIEDTYPIYYYRGVVSNNNAKFAGFCWKIVRTTETGGTKLLYNGLPDENDDCTNQRYASTHIGKINFNDNRNSMAYNGYMYGTVYEVNNQTVQDTYLYGNSFIYENGNYTLTSSGTQIDSTHHYTCLNDTGVCNEISYVIYKYGKTAYYITISDGKSISDAISDMKANITDSTMKIALDNWFDNSLKTYFTTNNKNYNDYLEDTIWCSDREISDYGAWNPNGGNIGDLLRYAFSARMTSGTPSLVCSNKNDSFTVAESLTGNGALTYPVGLLTADEVILVGGQSAYNPNYYLNVYQTWWTMTPSNCSSQGAANQYDVDGGGNSGMIMQNVVNDSNGIAVRPSISLKPEVKIAEGGDGSSTAPYEFVVE